MWLFIVIVVAAIVWAVQPRHPIDPDHKKVVRKTPGLALPTSAGGKPLKNPKGCHHDLCCDSLCPSLSQYYNPLTKSCMERPILPYGYGLAGGPCLVNFQDCSANPPTVPGPDLGLPGEGGSTCGALCDRFGGSLYYTGFTGVAAMKPPFVPSTYDGFQTFMGAKYASDNYVSSASSFSGGI